MYAGDWLDQAEAFNNFSLESFAWKFIERPALAGIVTPLLQSNTKVLDVGCGGGRICSWLIDHGAKSEHVTGIDISPAMLQIAHSRQNDISLQLTDIAQPIAIQGRTGYNVAIAMNVFQHLDPIRVSPRFVCRYIISPVSYLTNPLSNLYSP